MDRVPDAYFREMPSRCTGVELVLLGNILNETCGAGQAAVVAHDLAHTGVARLRNRAERTGCHP